VIDSRSRGIFRRAGAGSIAAVLTSASASFSSCASVRSACAVFEPSR